MKRTATLLIAALLLALVAPWPNAALAQAGNTWTVQYYNNPNWSGSPAAVQYVPYIEFNWGANPPMPGMPATNWTATMTSVAFFYSGIYVFSATADDEVMLQIDGVTYLNTIGAGMSGKPVSINVPLNQGNHNLLLQYRQYTGTAYVYLTWAYASSGTPYPPPYPPYPPPPVTPTPAACNPSWSCTCPTQATTVTTQYGDYTPCIQQNLPQSQCFVPSGQWDSPDMGSITSEPTIQVWGACTPGQQQTMQLACNQAPVTAVCSKTGAGWFYYGP